MTKSTLWKLAGCLGAFVLAGMVQLNAAEPAIPRGYYSKDNPLWPLERVDVRPEPIEQLPPRIDARFPKGTVVVDFIISKTGAVEFPSIRKSIDKRVDEPTLEAVRKWKFKPAIKNGKPANCFVSQRLDFN